MIDARKVQLQLRELALVRLHEDVTKDPNSLIGCLIDVIVEAVNAELESRVATADTQLLERAMCVIADELNKRGL